MNQDAERLEQLVQKIEKLNEVGIALSCEAEAEHLSERILLLAKELSSADGGTFYLVTDQKALSFEIVRNDSLGLRFGGYNAVPSPYSEISLYLDDGEPNLRMIAAYVAIEKKTVNIPNAYQAEGFDFSGMRAFDQKTGYRSESFLAVPLVNHEGEVMGVIQLINALDPQTKETVPFSLEDQHVVESLASQAAVALNNQRLINGLKGMVEGFIEAFADAIDAKSPYTGDHCRRVPLIAMQLAHAVNRSQNPVFKNFHFTKEELYELEIAALLHDCGKVTTPVHVVDKSTRLETIFDRIHLVDTRFEVIKRDREIAFLHDKIACMDSSDPNRIQELEQKYYADMAKIDSDREFIEQSNQAMQCMDEPRVQRAKEISAYRWKQKGEEQELLSKEELENLCIRCGTLNDGERKVIQDHVVNTIRMLNKIPYPKHLQQVPEIAGGHHERIDGKGYPAGLNGRQLSLQARILGIADIFEALTSCSRPYKKAMMLSKALEIMNEGKDQGQIDPDLFQVFVDEKVFLEFAREHLPSEQIDIS
ncbi:MAG: phosphohydrolase [Waddliaceae bacterium]|nr:phosphohydrolase [Waddliaceae bacterium]